MRGGSVGVRAPVPEPAGGVVQSVDGGAEKDSFRLVSDYKALPRQPPQSGGDLLSRWVSVPALPARAVAVFSPCDQDDSMSSKAVVRQAQKKALATDGTEVQSFESAVGFAVLDDEGLFRIHCLLYTSPSPRD